MLRHISLQGKKFPYTLTRKQVKNINLRIKPSGEIAVSAAKSVPLSVIEDFLQRKADWILAALEQVQQTLPLPENTVWLQGRALPLPPGETALQWQKRMAAQLLPAVYEEAWLLFQQDGFPKPTLRLRSMKSRWGSCIPGKGIITLNTALVGATPDCQLAVAAHELCHMLHPNHSKAFYAALEQHFPDYLPCRQALKSAQAFLFYL